MVGDFGGGREDGGHLPLPALLSRISATRRKRSAFATDVRRTSTLAWLLPRYLWSKKKAALSGAGFFLCFLYASARTVTVVMVMVVVMVVLMRFMDVVTL